MEEMAKTMSKIKTEKRKWLVRTNNMASFFDFLCSFQDKPSDQIITKREDKTDSLSQVDFSERM
jgi:hypothetical protein